MRNNTPQPGRSSTGVASEGVAARDLLPAVAMGGPAEPPRAASHRPLRVRLQPEER